MFKSLKLIPSELQSVWAGFNLRVDVISSNVPALIDKFDANAHHEEIRRTGSFIPLPPNFPIFFHDVHDENFIKFAPF